MPGPGPYAARRTAAQTTADLRALADEQSALRRVAELVADGVAPSTVLDAVAREACGLLGGHFTTLLRYETDGPAVIVAMYGSDAVDHVMHVGMRLASDGDGVVQRVRRSARAVRVDAYDDVPVANAATARSLGLSSGVGAPILVEGRVWGAITVLGSGPPLPDSAESRLAMFAKLVATAISNAQAYTSLAELADGQTALRRIAELTAQEASADVVLEAVAVQASRLAGVEFGMVLRFEPDGSTEIVALDGAPANFAVGMHAPAGGDSSVRRVWQTGRAARVDNLGEMSGQWPRMASRFGFSASAGVPIPAQGRLWGAIIVVGRDAPMPPAIEAHLTDFAELVSTAIFAAQTRAELRVLVDEQAALRRVAELVARGAALDDVFAAVAAEASKLLGDLAAVLMRHDPDDVAVVVAASNSPTPLGARIPAGAAPADPGAGARVAVPITVERRVWGALSTSTAGPRLPVETDARLAQFAELAAAAIANAENKAKLTASRARVIATADETRRRLQRDLHDGSQQRLVHALITLQLAKQALQKGEQADTLIDEALHHAERANAELRDLVRGILPASLTRGGLRAGVEALVSDLPIRVDLEATVPRLPAATETTAYFIVAEALTNVVKHADASHASVEIRLEDAVLSIAVRDDGSGGADPADGTGLTGLLDRVEASAGTLEITSPPGLGTTLRVTLPLGIAA